MSRTSLASVGVILLLSASVAGTQDDRQAEAARRRDLGAHLRKHHQYAAARVELLAALERFEELGDRSGAGWTLHHLGWVAYDSESGDAARTYWTRGLSNMIAAGDRRGEAQLSCDAARAMRPGAERSALLRRSLELSRELKDTPIEADALFMIGQQQLWEGQYARSLETLQQALDGFERLGLHAAAAKALIAIGSLYVVHGEFARATRFFERGIALLQRLGDKAGIADATGTLANMHRVARDFRQAAIFARRAVALTAAMGPVWRANQERLRLAWIYIEAGDHRRARPLIDEVMRGPDPFTRDLAYDPLSEVHLAAGEYEAARQAADLAARTARETRAVPLMLTNRARAEDKLGRTDEALASIDEALRLAEQDRQQVVPTDPMKQGYGERVQRLFAYAVDLRARAGHHAAALEAAEQARARAFLDLLAARDAPAIESRGHEFEVPSAAAAAPFSLPQLAAAAGRLRSTILTYWVGAERTIVWVVDGRGLVRSAIVPVAAARLTALVSQTWQNAAAIEPVPGEDAALFVRKSATSQAWRTLHDLLIVPIREHLPADNESLLTIIPHGPLSRLSFAALRDERGRFLIERYAVHYVPAGGVLADNGTTVASDVAAKYLLVANAVLPAAVSEIRDVGRLLPSESVISLSGSAARESRVRELLAGPRVVHFATHAVLRDDRPLESFLTLAAGPAHDGRLTAREIYGLSLDADLVVLSACRTAAGPVTGDGIVGLTRAFFYAGTPSVVATLWDLADESGRETMPAFYRAWLAGHDKARALRSAQLALLKRLRDKRVVVNSGARRVILEQDPFLWAGFVIIGEL